MTVLGTVLATAEFVRAAHRAHAIPIAVRAAADAFQRAVEEQLAHDQIAAIAGLPPVARRQLDRLFDPVGYALREAGYRPPRHPECRTGFVPEPAPDRPAPPGP